MVLGFVFDKLKKALQKTKETFSNQIKSIITALRRADEGTLSQLQDALIQVDVGVQASQKIVSELRRAYKEGRIKTEDGAQKFLLQYLYDLLKGPADITFSPVGPTVVLVVGVNGTGKTTSIAKLAHLMKQRGKRVLICAGDTFRAGAIEQISIWTERAGVEIIRSQEGSDPASVVFDALTAATSRSVDLLIIDTAGRLQTKESLMRELEKINRVIAKKIPGGPHEVILVVDGTTGQNALSQAKHFKEVVNLSGIFVAKLDGTAKGGIVIAIKDELGIPVKFVGTGEGMDDISPFDSKIFVDTLLAIE